MGERATEKELIALEHEWSRAVADNDLETLERIVAPEYTLAANNFPGGQPASVGRSRWLQSLPTTFTPTSFATSKCVPTMMPP
jgi:hypothetical protein